MRSNWIILLAVGASAVLAESPALAQEVDPASATGKGIAGGALLGAEAVMLVEAFAEVRPAWAYLVGGVAGAVGGGVGGYFIESGTSARASMYILTAGMALMIPTTIAVLSQTHYKPPADFTEDRPPEDAPAAEPPAPAAPRVEPTPAPAPAPAPAGRAPALHHRTASVPLRLPPPSLFRYDGAALLLSVPSVELRDVFTKTELAELDVKQETEVRVSVLDVAF